MKVNYWLAQYTEDPLRREPRNIGVIVENCVNKSARFLGEDSPTDDVITGIDGRRLRQILFDGAYKSWVRKWRLHAFRSDGGVVGVENHYNDSFKVIPGGSMIAEDYDNVLGLTDYLFNTLVYDDFNEALESIGQGVELEPTSLKLVDSVDEAFYEKGFIVDAGQEEKARANGFISPVVRKPLLKGGTIDYTLDMMQKDFVKRELWIMQAVDFSTRNKSNIQRNAGYSAFVSSDIKKANDNVRDIAIINMTQKDKEDYKAVRDGLKVLEENMYRIVNWTIPSEREAFIEERESIALGAA
jgi:hypothetical protein